MGELMCTRTEGNLGWEDYLVIAIYFAVVIAVGIFASVKASKSSLGGYFLADRSMHWLLVGASLFGSNIGSGHYIGLAGSGASSGIGVAWFEISAIFALILLGWLFVPVYIASGVFTMPEYLRKRFGGQRIRVVLSVLALVLYTFTKISADLFAGALFIKLALGWNLYLAIIILLAISALFTISGGLTAVIATDAVQVVIMIIGAFILMGMTFSATGGYDSLIEQYYTAIPTDSRYMMANTTCSMPLSYSMNLMRPLTADFPWLGMIVGLAISSVWYWCSDQVIVQRTLAAKNYSHAKAGCVFAGYLKLLPMWLLVFPGMAARVLYPNQIACSDPDMCECVCDNRAGCSNVAFPLLVINLMPKGLTGLMLAVMLSALISSLTSIFNSASTIFTIDIWKLIRKNKASNVEMLIAGRVFVLVMVVVSIFWIPIINAFPGGRLFDYIQAITSYLAPPVCAVYVLGIFYKRTNEQGAFWGLIIGFIIGMIRFIIEVSYTAPGCGEVDTRPLIISKVHYLHFGILLFGLSVMVTLVVSWMTPPIDDKHLYRLTYQTRYSEADRISLRDPAEEDEIEREKENAQRNDIYTVQQIENPTESPKAAEPANGAQRIKKYFEMICGIEKQTSKPSRDELRDKHLGALDETHQSKMFLDIMALVVMAIAVFFWAFYA